MSGLKDRFDAGDLLLGAEVTSASAGAVELMAGMSFDLLVIDARHAAVSPYSNELEELVRAGDAHDGDVLVRIGLNTPGTINRTMNDGAGGILVAVDDAESAEQAAKSMRYPPAGFRGAAPVVRAAHYGLVPWDEYRTATNDQRVVVASIESETGLAAAGPIAGVAGVDAVVLDAFNLAVALELRATPEVDVIATALAEIRDAGTIAGVTLPNPAGAEAWRDAGCTLMIVGNDVAAYTEATVRLRESLRSVPTSLSTGAPE